MRDYLKIIAILPPVMIMVLTSGAGAADISFPCSALLPEQMDSAGVDSTESWTIMELKEVLNRETGAVPEGAGWKKKKNARVAMLCALVFPGLGQMYNEKPYKAVLAMGLETFYLSQILFKYRAEARERKLRDSYDRYLEGDEINPNWYYHDIWYNEYKEQKIDWVWWSAGLLVALIFDAYVDAHLHDMNFQPGENGGLTFSFDF